MSAALPTQFRTGHVTAKQPDAKAVTKTDAASTIKLLSGGYADPDADHYKGNVSRWFSTKEHFCFDGRHRQIRSGAWTSTTTARPPAVCGDDIIVFNTESCTIFALDMKTGKNLWSYFLGDPLTSTPTNGERQSLPPRIPRTAAAGVVPRTFRPSAKPNPKGNLGAKVGAAAYEAAPQRVARFHLPGIEDGKILWQNGSTGCRPGSGR